MFGKEIKKVILHCNNCRNGVFNIPRKSLYPYLQYEILKAVNLKRLFTLADHIYRQEKLVSFKN